MHSTNAAILFEHEEKLLTVMLHLTGWSDAQQIADAQYRKGNTYRASATHWRGTLVQLIERGLVMRREARRGENRRVGYSISPDGVRWLHAREDTLRASLLHRRAMARRAEHASAVVRTLEDVIAWPETKLAARVGWLTADAERQITEHVHNMAWAATVGYEWPEHVVALSKPVLA